MLEKQLYKSFGTLVSEKRRRAKLTQHDLAQALGLSRASVANIERGKQPIQLHSIFKIASVLHVDVRELIPTLEHEVGSMQIREWLDRIQTPSRDGLL